MIFFSLENLSKIFTSQVDKNLTIVNNSSFLSSSAHLQEDLKVIEEKNISNNKFKIFC